MDGSKGNRGRSVLIIAIVLLAVVATAVFGYRALANPAQLEATPSQTAEVRPTDTAE
jgi:flagellar basal body-associated protein FliL